MQICKATMGHIQSIHHLVNSYAEQGRMLHRSQASLYEQVRDFSVVIDEDGDVIAVGALHVLWHDLAELRAFAVAPETTSKGIGKELVDHLVDEAVHLGITRICLLTYESGFFEKCQFKCIEKQELPLKVLKECMYCDNFDNCKEIPMIRHITTSKEDSCEVGHSMNLNLEIPVHQHVMEAKKAAEGTNNHTLRRHGG